MDKWDNVCTQVNTCALTGAATFFAGIPDAAILSNGPLWCYFYALRHLEKTEPEIAARFYCSQADNSAVVYGTEEKLLNILQLLRKNIRPAVLLIENSCSVSLIGDDVAGIASQVDLPWPVVCLDTGGSQGGFREGYCAAAKEYFSVMPLQPRNLVKSRTVNLLGCTIGYYNSAHDINELKRMLALAGYQVLACPGVGSSTEEIAKMTEAELNIVVHEELGLEVAKILQEHYGMPYISLLPPYGIDGSLHWLQELGQAMHRESNHLQAVQKEANNWEKKLRLATLGMQRIWGEIWFEKALVAAPSSVALGIAKALRYEWADIGYLSVLLHDCLPVQFIPAEIDELLDGDSQLLEKKLASLEGGLLLASSNEKTILQQQAVANVVCQNIALPVHDEVILSDRPFMGLRGNCHLNERLWNQYIDFSQRRR